MLVFLRTVPLDMVEDEEAEVSAAERHLEWSAKQSYILTGGGVAESLYTARRGFDFRSDELPHFHLISGKSHSVFLKWSQSKEIEPCSLISGCWKRPLFVGGWKHSTDSDEDVYNVQTHNMFVDMRIPKALRGFFGNKAVGKIDDLSPLELRLYARQHIFAGYGRVTSANSRSTCTRHHCIDWNFVGTPRSRPNRWWIQMNEDKSTWKELSFATDEHSQHYYFERWERRGQMAIHPRLALRKAEGCDRDGVIVIVGDHFNFVFDRMMPKAILDQIAEGSLVEAVDNAVGRGDLCLARSLLSMEGGHGRVSKNWMVDTAIPFWTEGSVLWDPSELAFDEAENQAVTLTWKSERWIVYDSSFPDIGALKAFFDTGAV